jgi:head-tail adaptor
MAGPAEMSAARLRDRVQIQAPTETSSSTGQPVQGWETAATVWAEVTPAGGGEVVDGPGLRGEGVTWPPT